MLAEKRVSVPSEFLNAQEFRGLKWMGNAICPGNKHMPRFSKLGCAEYVDRLLVHMAKEDLEDLKKLLQVFSFIPPFLLRWVLRILDVAPKVPGSLGASLRLMRLGTKGLIVSLYYSGYHGKSFKGKTPLEAMSYQVDVYTGDLT